MQDSIAGATNYQNQSHKEIVKDFEQMIDYSKKIIRNNKEFKNVSGDLRWIFNEIVLFANKLEELSEKNISSFKNGMPKLFFTKSLKEMGTDALELDCKIGKIWHARFYDDSKASAIKYAELRDYIISMIDLNNVGWELERRYFKNDKPLYKEKNAWKYVRDIIEIFINAIFNIFKK